MKHLFVPYEIALQLKEKGFDEECIFHLNFMNDIYASTKELTQPSFWLSHNEQLKSPVIREQLQKDFNNQLFVKLGFPLYQQVIDWLFKKLDLNYPMLSIEIFSDNSGKWCHPKDDGYEKLEIDFDNLNKAIEEALKLI